MNFIKVFFLFRHSENCHTEPVEVLKIDLSLCMNDIKEAVVNFE